MKELKELKIDEEIVILEQDGSSMEGYRFDTVAEATDWIEQECDYDTFDDLLIYIAKKVMFSVKAVLEVD